MSHKYKLLIYAVHSALQSGKSELVFNDKTTVGNFRENESNNKFCLDLHKYTLKEYNYELSWSQMSNGINLFLKSL